MIYKCFIPSNIKRPLPVYFLTPSVNCQLNANHPSNLRKLSSNTSELLLCITSYGEYTSVLVYRPIRRQLVESFRSSFSHLLEMFLNGLYTF